MAEKTKSWSPRELPRDNQGEQESKRIYIHGVGNVGMLVAHSLRGIPDPPPVTLLFYKANQLDEFRSANYKITVTTGDESESRGGFGTELVSVPQRVHGMVVPSADAVRLQKMRIDHQFSGEQYFDAVAELEQETRATLMKQSSSGPPIKHLILTVKASGVVASLLSVKGRLGPESTVLFMCNGMGFIEEVNEEVFPDPATRPRYMLGINSHGLNRDPERPFETTHAGFGTVSIGLAPTLSASPIPRAPGPDAQPPDPNLDLDMIPSSAHILHSIIRTPVLTAAPFSPIELLKCQLDKLAVNSVINPLTALLDCRNGGILYNYALTRTMRLLLTEISTVFQALPELYGQPNIGLRFGPELLETTVVGIAHKTRDNVSSMLQDVRAGKRTEIEYLNGFVVRKGEELGVTCGFNFMVEQMVRGKQQMVMNEEDDMVPFVQENLRRYDSRASEVR